MRSVAALKGRLAKVVAARQRVANLQASFTEADRSIRGMQMYAAGVPRLVELLDRARARRNFSDLA